jgi:GT2 family glycosyltransferase
MNIAVSVVVPTYQRPELLDRCLRALTSQEFDPNGYEIIVANDRPSDAIEHVVSRWQRRTKGPRIHYVPVRNTRGPAAARNRGWEKAAGDIIAFTDDDTVPMPNWLARGRASLKGDVIASWGYVTVPLPKNPTDYELDASKLEGAEFVTANCFVRRTALMEVGGFDERFTTAWREDSDLFFSLKKIGKVIYAPGAVVVHPIRPAPWGVSIRQQRKVLFDALLFKKHPNLYRQKIRRSPPWSYYFIFAALISTIVAAALGMTVLTASSFGVWLALTARFWWRRIRSTSRSLMHVLEMAVTSIVIPPLALFWRWVGAFKFRVLST